jgi:NAD(P)-dependent dehydrogenase (short-subunit alcohol dehydrogenase family)
MNSHPKDLTLLITGANGGIGMATTKALLKQNVKRIILACRTQQKAEAAMLELAAYNQHTELVPVGGFDMTDPAAIEEAIKTLPVVEPIDTVFLQSGGVVVSKEFQFVESLAGNIEKTVFQNAIGGFLTAEFLKHHKRLANGAKIVFAGGEGARGIPGLMPKPEYKTADDFLTYLTKGQGSFNVFSAIGVSKFASALLVQKLASLNDGYQYIWFSPGLTGGTSGLDPMPKLRRTIMKHIGFPVMQLIGIAQSPEKAAQKNVDCLLGEIGSNGDILGAPEGKALGKIVDQKPMNSALTNHQIRDAFWQFTAPLIAPVTAHINKPFTTHNTALNDEQHA